MCERMLKKVLMLMAVVAVLVGLVVGIRWLNTSYAARVSVYHSDEVQLSNDQLTPMLGSGLQLVDENDALQLWINFDDGNLEVVHKADGYVWRSCPTEEEMALEKSNALWSNNLRAPIMFTYVQETSAANTKYTNTITENAEITVYKLDGGVRVYFELTEHAVTLAYDAYLRDDMLEVSMPSYLISDPGTVYKTSKSGKTSLDKDASCIIAEIYLFPNLGATRSDMGVEGALLVPDGTGALIDFQSDQYVNSQYIASVYGSDIALSNGYDSTLRSELSKTGISFPVYGVVRDGHTMMAVIDQGETQASVVASKAGVQTGFNTVSVRYTYRMKYKVITNSSTGDGYLNYTSFAVEEPRKVCYFFGTGNYVDMAGQYRTYLQEKYDLHRVEDEDASLQLNLVGGDTESGILGDTFIAMTTFEQAEDILCWFSNNGIQNMDVTYTGWGKRGESVEYPKRFPAAGALGGNGGLKTLAKAAEALNAKLYLRDNHVLLGTTLGISVGKNTVYNIQGNPLFEGAFANTAFMNANYEKGKKQYSAYGVSGLLEEGVGTLLMTDYSSANATSRTDAMAAQRMLLQKMVEDFGVVRLAGSNAYALMDGVVMTELPSSSGLTLLDESVPFYTIALHGLVDYICGDYMDYYEQTSQLLEAVDRGGNVSFTLSWESTELLKRADTAAYYSTTFELWREDVLNIWQRLEPYLNATRGKYIIGYESLAPGVTLTTYEDQTQVVVNKTGESFQWGNEDIAAMDFVLLKGE